MSVIQSKLISAGLFFLFIFLTGLWLSHSGRPLNGILLTIHKLIALGAGIAFTISVYQVNLAAKLNGLEVLMCLVTGLFFIGTIVTGGLISVDKPMPALVHRLHQITPYLTVVSTAVTLYFLLLARRGSEVSAVSVGL